jgi:hypothetical protein
MSFALRADGDRVGSLLPAGATRPIGTGRCREGEWWFYPGRSGMRWTLLARRTPDGVDEARYRPRWIGSGGTVDSSGEVLRLTSHRVGGSRRVLIDSGRNELLRASGEGPWARPVTLALSAALGYRPDAALLILLVALLTIIDIPIPAGGDGGGG